MAFLSLCIYYNLLSETNEFICSSNVLLLIVISLALDNVLKQLAFHGNKSIRRKRTLL